MVSDLYAHDRGRLSERMGFFGLVPSVCGIFAPLLCAALFRRHKKLPALFAVAGGFAALAIGSRVRETLPERKPFALRDASPLSFLQLFTAASSTLRLRLLSLLYLLSFAVETIAMPPGFLSASLDVDLQQRYGWGPIERARFRTVQRLCTVPGYALVRPIVQRFGDRGALVMGQAASILYTLLLGNGSSK